MDHSSKLQQMSSQPKIAPTASQVSHLFWSYKPKLVKNPAAPVDITCCRTIYLNPSETTLFVQSSRASVYYVRKSQLSVLTLINYFRLLLTVEELSLLPLNTWARWSDLHRGCRRMSNHVTNPVWLRDYSD